MRKTVYLRESVKWREQGAGIIVSCCLWEAAPRAQHLLSQQTGGGSGSGSNEDCTFHHRRAANFMNISSLLLTESLRQMSQRVGRDPGRRLHSRTTEGLVLEGRVGSQGDASCFGTRKALSRLRPWEQSWAEKAPPKCWKHRELSFVYLPHLPGGNQGKCLRFSGPSFTETIVAVPLPQVVVATW